MTFVWPPIDAEVQNAVQRQMRETVSIYGRSGIIARFEDAFAARHRTQHPLLTSSGTAALHSAYYALGIGPGDEVLVQDYTFFATAMPLFQLGAVPVLIDVDLEGSIELGEASSMLSEHTKALVVTHMWGNPQDTRRIRAFCDRARIALVEDCSHAHGAARNNTSVGELADVACWSLQGKKVVTAGEGGILTTPDREVYERATMLGHFNKRALGEVDPSSALYPFAETGLGLKYRAHPLGLAMAEVYLSRLDVWLEHKQRHARQMERLVAGVPGIHVLTTTGPDRVGTFYGFVFRVEVEAAGFTRDELIAVAREQGCDDIDTCDSMRPLHTYPIFSAPQSPVARYRAPLIRSGLFTAERLAAQTIRVPVPVDDSSAAQSFMARTTRALTAAIDRLSG